MKKLFSIIIALLIGTVAFSQQRIINEVFTSVHVDHDIIYAQNYSILTGLPVMSNLMMDVYQPAGDTAKKRPLIIFLHGGQFFPKDAFLPFGAKNDSLVIEICTQFAKRGFVAAAIDYRLGWNPLGSDFTIRAGTFINAVYRAMQDAKACIRYFRKDAVTLNSFHINTNQIILAGTDVGASVCVAASCYNKTSELSIPKHINPNTGNPYVDQSTTGDFNGEGGNSANNFENNPGFSSQFRMALSLGGYTLDTSFIESGEPPIVCFHGYVDPLAPFETTLLIVSGSNSVTEVSGSGAIARKQNLIGNNLLWKNAGFNDPITQIANSRMPAYEGLFWFPGANNGFEPWAWYDQMLSRIINAGNPSTNFPPPYTGYGSAANPYASRIKAEAYLDTIMRYFTPRVLTVFNDPNLPVFVPGESPVHKELQVFPNPTSGITVLTFDNPESHRYTLIIYDIHGKAVQIAENITCGTCISDLNNLNAGIYIIELRGQDVFHGKILVNKE